MLRIQLSKWNVILDTNVIVSAFLSNYDDAATVIVLNMFYDEKINLFYSDEILKEYEDVLYRKKFDFDKNIIKRFIGLIKENGIKINPKKIEEEMIDIKDKPFYELVMDKNIDNGKLITGNIKHYPKNKYIMTPAEFVEMFKDQI